MLATAALLLQTLKLPDFATIPHPRTYGCVRAAEPPPIDGNLSHQAWKNAPWSEPFLDIEGPQHVPQPRYKTRMKMMWDDKFLYVGAEMEEPDIWATLTKRDSVIFHDNDFEIFIDPDDDNHRYIEFEINALNTVWDLYLPKPYRDGGQAMDSFDMKSLQSAVKLDGTLNNPASRDRGWSVTVAIPWEDIRFASSRRVPPREGDRWRINFSRVEWDLETRDGRYGKVEGKPEHNWVWSPQWVINMHWPEMWGFLEFQGRTTKPVAKDRLWRERMQLHEIYHKQIAYREKNGKWAPSLADLGIDHPVQFLCEEDYWFASIESRGKTLTIHEDSRVTISP